MTVRKRLMTSNRIAVSAVMIIGMAGCATREADNLMKKAMAACLTDHPADQPGYRTSRAQCVEGAGVRILVPTLSSEQAAMKEETWSNDVLLAQQVDNGQITAEQAEALSAGLRLEMRKTGN